MAQATPQVNQVVRQLQGYSLSIFNSKLFRQWSDRVQESWRWGAGLGVLGLALLWNWQLVLTVSLGLVVMVWVYLARQGWWKLPKAWNWQKLWSPPNRSLTLAVASGSLATVGSYLAIAIWQESHHSWLATGIIIEGGMVLAVLGLMSWQTLNRAFEPALEPLERQDDRSFPILLADLADTDPLKRLIAVRLLTQQASNASSRLPLSAADLTDCFRLMLDRETEAAVCSALLDGLHSLKGLPAKDTRSLALPEENAHKS